VCEAAWENNAVEGGEVGVLVPDEFYRLMKDLVDYVVGVPVTVCAREH
jgi:hypothetical protein